MRRRALAWGLSGAVMALAACQAVDTRPLPPSVPVVRVAMTDYRFEHEPVVPGGRVVLRARNADDVDHALTLVRLPDGVTATVAELVGDAVQQTFPTTAMLFRRHPGQNGVFAVDLRPGRYALFCFLPDGDGELHYEKGMFSEFQVR